MEMQKIPQAGFQIRVCGLRFTKKISLQNLMFHLVRIVYGKQKNNKEFNPDGYRHGGFASGPLLKWPA
jgi:hypothetical protein